MSIDSLKIALLPTIQTGSKLDFVHLSRITDGGNKALEKSGRDFNHLVFLVDLRKSRSWFPVPSRRGKMPRLQVWRCTVFRTTQPLYFCTKSSLGNKLPN
jgi:hypothetical protein